jgi:hypothetical protein
MLLRLLAALLALGLPALAQQFAPLTLQQITRKAGLIFAGTVTSVERVPSDVPELRVTFRVKRAVRGTRSGATVVIREWISPLDAPRYRPGENVFLFLYGAGPNRLTSPVGGASGRFSLDAGWNIVPRPGQPRPLSGAGNEAPGRGRAPSRVPLHTFLRALRSAEPQ